MTLIAEILLIFANVLMAWWHSRNLTRIKHGWWAAVFVALVVISVLLLGLNNWVTIGIFSLTACIGRMLFFNASLNLFRKDGEFGILYISPNVKACKGYWDALMKGRFWDYVHWRAFGVHSEIYLFVYLAAFIILNIYLCL